MAVTPNELENAARLVYQAMSKAVKPYSDRPTPWVPGGNSDMQMLARETTERVINGLVLELVPPEWRVVEGRTTRYRCVEGLLQYKPLTDRGTDPWGTVSHVPIPDFDLVAELRANPRAPVKTLVEQAMEQLGKAGYLVHSQYGIAADGMVSRGGADIIETKPVYIITKEPQR